MTGDHSTQNAISGGLTEADPARAASAAAAVPAPRRTRSSVARIVIPETEHPRLSVVIVTYRTGGIVLEALEALTETLAGERYEVIVVDNRAPMALRSATLLRLRTRGVRLVEVGHNAGFAAANNIGVAHARGELLCLLNPDALPQPGWLEPLVAALDDPTVGIAAPVLLNPDGSVQEAGARVDSYGGTSAVTDLPHEATIDVEYSSAACWLIRAEVFRRLGGFDEAYWPAYYEDLDFAMTAASEGLRRVVCRGSRVVHHHGASTPGPPPILIEQHRVFWSKWAAAVTDRSLRSVPPRT